MHLEIDIPGTLYKPDPDIFYRAVVNNIQRWAEEYAINIVTTDVIVHGDRRLIIIHLFPDSGYSLFAMTNPRSKFKIVE